MDDSARQLSGSEERADGPDGWTADAIQADWERRSASLQQVEAEVLACRRCRLAATRTQAVPGEGDGGAVVLFVGEGPGQEEDRQGRPFVGRSGQLLTRNLERIGISRKDVFITNVVKCRPPENRDPEPDEIAACFDYLTRQIALINPRIIVTLGRFSMARFFPGAKVSQIHGQVKNIGGGRVALAMFHPAAALRSPQVMRQFEEDFDRLPALVARAQRANEAALRGEALPAGVPHPGDHDYVAGTVAGTAAASGAAVHMPMAPDADGGPGAQRIESVAHAGDADEYEVEAGASTVPHAPGPDDGATQLSFF